MTIVCPRPSESLGCMMRAVMSRVPPGGNGTMNRTGLAGYSCASACDPMPIAQPAIRASPRSRTSAAIMLFSFATDTALVSLHFFVTLFHFGIFRDALATFPLSPNAAFGQVPGDGSRFQASPGEPDVAVRTQQIESRSRDPHACELSGVVRFVGNHVDAQKVAESQPFSRRRRLPDDDQVVARVVELLEQVFDRAVRLEPEPQPRKTIARARRAARQARQHSRQRAFPVGNAGLGDGAERQR